MNASVENERLLQRLRAAEKPSLASAAGRNRRRAKMLMVRKKTKSYANAQGIKAVSTKRPLGVRKR